MPSKVRWTIFLADRRHVLIFIQRFLKKYQSSNENDQRTRRRMGFAYFVLVRFCRIRLHLRMAKPVANRSSCIFAMGRQCLLHLFSNRRTLALARRRRQAPILEMGMDRPFGQHSYFGFLCPAGAFAARIPHLSRCAGAALRIAYDSIFFWRQSAKHYGAGCNLALRQRLDWRRRRFAF